MYKIANNIDSKTLCDCIVEGMQENKAKDIVVLDLRDVKSAVTDFFIICSGELQERPWHTEGKENSEWILLDYVNVVAHIFHKDARGFYDLEDLWADAPRTDIPNLD